MKRLSHLSLAAAFAVAAIALVSLRLSSTPAYAATSTDATTAPKSDYSAAIERINKSFPDLPIDAIRPSPMPGLLEVVSNHRVFYTDPTGSYLLNGKLIDVQNRVDLTEKSVEDLSRIDPKLLPLADSFAEVRGNGKRQLYVFSDPDCPFCKKLEQEVPKLNDVTIHVFLFPLDSIHPHAHANAVTIWCSKDRTKAWVSQMHGETLPAAPTCDTPVDRNVALGEKLGFNATPTMVFADGRVLQGARPAQEIDEQLNRVQ